MFELLFTGLMGVLFLIWGLLLWKKQMIRLIHSYHYPNVTPENRKPYTERMGKAIIVMSIGMPLTGIIDYITDTSYGWICFGLFFIAGFALMLKVQKKYNGGLF